MNCTKQDFVAEIMRRKQARKAAREAEKSAQADFDAQQEYRLRTEFYDYRSNKKARGRRNTNRGFEC